MQDKWKDLIPFYVAGTLPDDDKQALEAYLAQCGAPCQDEVEEWRAIASATWQHVTASTPNLPPLSQAVLNEVARDAERRASGKIVTSNRFHVDGTENRTGAPVYPRPSTPTAKKVKRLPRVPLTMVAAFMTVVIFGGILLRQISLEDLQPETQVIELTDSIDASVNVTEQFGGEVGIQPDNPDNSGIIATPTRFAPQATLTFTPTPPPLPTRSLDLPENAGGGISDTSSIAEMPATGACKIRNDTQGALTTYRNASFDAEPVGIFRQGSSAEIQIVFGDWYQLSYGRWVYGGNVTVSGDCSNVWTATPTAVGDTSGGGSNTDTGIPDCIVRNDNPEPVNLYQWPDADSPVNGRMSVGIDYNIYVGANGWYQVFYAQWVNGADVTVEGDDCNDLWVPTPTFQPGTTPTPVPSPTPLQANAIVSTSITILRSLPSELGIFMEEVTQGTNLTIKAHNGLSGPQRWYLVTSPAGRTGWVPSLDVNVIPNDLDVAPAATVPFIPSVTPTGFVPTPNIERWSHVTTVVEHGCGGTVGEQATIPVQMQRLGSEIVITYPETGTSFSLSEIAPNTYAGSYGTAARIQIDLSFTSSTTYIANETVNQESGCIVRLTWAGTKQ